MSETKQTKIETLKEHLDSMDGYCSFLKAERLYKLDYRKVVLCKDCKYWRYIPYLEKYACDLADWHDAEEDTDYCSYGERRTNIE